MTTYAPLIETQTDLERAWRTLLSPLGFSRTSTWLMFIGPDGRPLPSLTEIEDCDGPPPPDGAEQMGGLLGHLRDGLPDGMRVAFLRSRPGPGLPDAHDRAWAAMLHDAIRCAGFPAEVVHLATGSDVRPLPLDEAATPVTT